MLQSAAKSRVMFSDLVGSTALSARMDPEDLREVISGYQKCVAETVQRFGGFVAKPTRTTQSEPPARGLTGLKTLAALQTRVGIATGLAVVGDLIGSGASQEQAIVGETPNLATRLQGIAEPNRSPENRTSQKQAADLETEAWYRSGIA
jgi:class 3 adenylate cyclase